MSRRVHAARRSFLKTLGAAAATLPFYNVLEASAAEAARPLRFIGLYHPHGCSSPYFTMRPSESETSFDLNAPESVLSPFAPYKDKLLVLEGMDLAAAVVAGTEGHAAPSCILTGSGGAPTHASLDQYLAVERGLGAATRLSSIVLGVGDGNTSVDSCISFGKGGTPLNKIIDPRQTFSTLFAGLTSNTDAAARAKAERDLSRGRSVIDYLRADWKRVENRLAPTEKHKLQQHLDSIRELEKRLAPLPASASCTGAPPEPETFSSVRSYNNGEPHFERITNLQVELLAEAIKCDLTRFATLWMADLSRGATLGTGITGLPEDCHNALAHSYSAPRGTHYGSGASAGDPATWAALGKQNRYSYSKAALLLNRLGDAAADTIVLMSSDMGDPNSHSSTNVPTVIAGGCGGKFRMGRRIKLAEDCPPDRSYCQDRTLVSNNKVLVSIAQAFGLEDVQSYGVSSNAAVTQGALSALK